MMPMNPTNNPLPDEESEESETFGLTPRELQRIASDMSHLKVLKRFHSSGIPYSLQDRFTYVGMTRTGKTTAARNVIAEFLREFPGLRVHIFDPKDEGDYIPLARLSPLWHVRGSVAPDPLRLPGVQLWHPQRAQFEDYEEWLSKLADDPNPYLLVIDEIKRMYKRQGDPNSGPFSLGVILQEGAGQWHGVHILMQELAGYARQILGQTTHLLRFRLANKYDARLADSRIERAKNSGRITNSEPAHWHGLFHSRIDALDNAREFSSWRALV